MLDLKIWLGKDCKDKWRIMHDQYMKPVSSGTLINYNSAHPKERKEQVLINDAKRIIRNCKSFLERIVIDKRLSYFSKRMQYSGYDNDTRNKIV